MENERLKAFSDGVIAILITILVLEIKVPHGDDFAALMELSPIFLSYILSFVYIGIYWNNHHHLLYACTRVNGAVLWSNLHLLFWLSLLPFATAWMDESHSAAVPTALYGAVLLMAAIAYYLLQLAILAEHGRDGVLARALGADWKGKLSPIAYVLAIVSPSSSRWSRTFSTSPSHSSGSCRIPDRAGAEGASGRLTARRLGLFRPIYGA